MDLVKTPYYWNIENDSYFFNKTNFLERVIHALECNADIAIVHLRRWTPFDCRDKPGAPQNNCRVKEIRNNMDLPLYVVEKLKDDCVWVDVGDGLPSDFHPYTHLKDDFKSLRLGTDPGCLRLVNGKWQRLIEDHYATYTTDGYVARSDALRFIIEKYNPQTEKDMSTVFKSHFTAARIDQDAFISFGWNTRIHPSEEQILEMFEWARTHNYSSILDYGVLKEIREVHTHKYMKKHSK